MTTAPNDPQAEQRYKNHVRAWTWYDWADHAYITTLASTFFPPYFVAIAAPAFLIAGAAATDEAATAIAKNTASDVFALTVSIALLVSAIIAPIIGTYADITGRRKRLLIIATGIGGLFSSMMFTLQTGSVVLGLGLYFITQVALNVALGSNSSLLPHVARQDDMDRVSSLGYAMGYFGGGVLLLVNTALYLFADKIGLDSGTAVRIAFLSVGIWWIIFMLPTARTVPEPPATPLAGGSGKPWRDSFTRLKHTFQSARHYEELFKMLIAFWLYSEGIGAIILLATPAAAQSSGEPQAARNGQAPAPSASGVEQLIFGPREPGETVTETMALQEAVVRLPIAAGLGALLAFRPRRRGTPPRTPPVIQTQIILAVVGALVMLVVGSSLARAFGIVGAAGLIRYRAKIEDPKDAAVMLSTLGVGLASGVGLHMLAGFATLFVLALLWVIESLEEGRKHFDLTVKADTIGRLRADIERVLRRHRVAYELRSSSDTDLCYAVSLPLERTTDQVSDALQRLAREHPVAVEWAERKPKA